ncbi:MAG: ArsR family transcriptional regulator [Chloroflexi bacterium]|nr:MAG: ArsR family transcriptional regulator [Chloroflexota bacterium]
MKTTRQHILDYLEIKQAASPVDIARALHLTAANIRHHLSILNEEGVVDVIDQRPAARKGRPSQVYALRRQVFTHNLDTLSSALLVEIYLLLPPEERSVFLKRLARRLISENRQTNPSQRLVHSVSCLNKMNYQARWEARADAPRVILGHCPYASILPEHPELCQMDAFMLEEMLGQPVLQTARLEKTPQGFRQCVFTMRRQP